MKERCVPSSIDIVFLGLAITSSWGNGHATTYRSLIKGLHRRGHRVLFLERDRPWYAKHRDAPQLPYCEVAVYSSIESLQSRFASRIRRADAVIVGSYVPEAKRISRWVLEQARGIRGFYDIDTPVTLAALRDDASEYLSRDHVSQFDMMLSFTGGPALAELESDYGARRALPLYCSVDTDAYFPVAVQPTIDLGYMGTYSVDRQPPLERLLNEPAARLPDRRFVVAGAQYPAGIRWSGNVQRIEHLPPGAHPAFFGSQRFTLNVTRADMRQTGFSPSVRLFEAAACAAPIVSDDWPGLATFFEPHREILIARTADDVVGYLCGCSDADRSRMARAARERVMAEHSGLKRAEQLERYIMEDAASQSPGHGRARRSAMA
jgi:spore maturation protein CgeB